MSAINKTKYLTYRGCSDDEPTELFETKLASFGDSSKEIFKKMCFVIKAIIEISCDENGVCS